MHVNWIQKTPWQAFCLNQGLAKIFDERYKWACNLTTSTLRGSTGIAAIKVTVIDFRFVFDLHGYYLTANHRFESNHHAALIQRVYKDSCMNHRKGIRKSDSGECIVYYTIAKGDLSTKLILHLTEIKSFFLVLSALTNAKSICWSQYDTGDRRAAMRRWHF